MAEQDNSQNNRSLELCRRIVTTESFIAEAKEIYGERYDYSKVVYKNRDHRVVVVCPVHGDFQVFAREHLDGKGCPKCEKGEKFIAKLREKFDEKFGLDEFVYESSTSPVTLICPKHGAFSRLPHQVLDSKCGCPKCGVEFQRIMQEKLHQEALERKEKERIDRLEAERIAFEIAQEEWREKILTIESCQFQSTNWYEDFFGFDLTHLCLDNGDVINGRVYPKLDYSHYPFKNADIEAENGKLIKASFYLSSYDTSYFDEQLFLETLFVGDSLISDGEIATLEQVSEKYHLDDYYIYKFDNIVDGYKIQIIKRSNSVEIKVRRVGTGGKFRYRKMDIRNVELPSDFVSIDFETLYPQRVSACSVGMVKYIEGKAIDRFYTLIRPPFEYPGKCGKVLSWIHGITEDMVKNQRTFREVLPHMEEFVDQLPLVAHNACVERACIRDACSFYGLNTTLDYENIIDTLPLSYNVEASLGIEASGPGSHSLNPLCNRFEIEERRHHNALDDAEMCGDLFVKFKALLTNEHSDIKLASLSGQIENSKGKSTKYNPEDKVQRSDLNSVPDNPFKNQVVVLTGFAKTDSQEYAHKLNELGAIIKEGVNKKTNILITGYNAGPSKMQKAQEFGARIMLEEEFKEIIKQL